MDSSVVGAIVAGFGALILFMLNKIFENNKKYEGEERREPDQSIVGVYAELLHITTTVTKIDSGMDELIRRLPMSGQGSSDKSSIEALRDEMKLFRRELNGEVVALSKKISEVGTKDKED